MSDTPSGRPVDDPASAEASIGQDVQQQSIDEANRTMPGGREALPAGTLRHARPAPQADEHRDQPIASNGETRLPDTPPLVD